ncbi:hypothetical protein ACQP2U_23975 [Nocardia sp. CA-084685]
MSEPNLPAVDSTALSVVAVISLEHQECPDSAEIVFDSAEIVFGRVC